MGFIKEYRFGNVQAFQTGKTTKKGDPLITAFSYLAGGVMIDTGIRKARKEVLQAHMLYPVEAVCLTHHHEDHSGNAAAMKDLWGVQVFGHPLCVEKMAQPYPIMPYQHFFLGRTDPMEMEPYPERIETDKVTLLPIHTPGHSKDHTCYFEPNQGWLFSGDMYLGDHIRYFRSDENIGEQIVSLKTLMDLDFDCLFCAHHPQPLEGKEHIQAKLDYLEDLYGKVVHLRQKGMGGRSIMRELAIKEVSVHKMITLGNVSAANMIRSALETAEAGGPHRLSA